MEIEKELKRLEETVAESEKAIEKSKGVLETLYKQLKDNFDCVNLEQARELLDQKKEAQKELEKDIKNRFENINEEFEW